MTEVNEMKFSKGGKMAEGGGKKKLIILIIGGLIGLLVLGGIGFVAYSFLAPADPLEEAAADGAATPIAGGRKAGLCPGDQLRFLPLGTFIVNLSDGRRYLKTNIEIMLCDEKVDAISEYINLRLVEVKDLVISELQTLSTEQLRDPRERETLKQRLLRKIESLLPNRDVEWVDIRPIKKVLVTEFYLQ